MKIGQRIPHNMGDVLVFLQEKAVEATKQKEEKRGNKT
jgi:hypothetical protein